MTKQITYEVTVYPDRTEWRLNGKFHRENDPAIECANGTKYWYSNDQLHRENGPAFEYANGDKQWWLNGKRHREDGPAIEYANGDKQWWLNGQKYSEKEYNEKMKPSCEGKVIEIEGQKYKLVKA